MTDHPYLVKTVSTKPLLSGGIHYGKEDSSMGKLRQYWQVGGGDHDALERRSPGRPYRGMT